jgi:hypothetical protein
LLWVNFKLAAVRCCRATYSPSLQCCAVILAWPEKWCPRYVHFQRTLTAGWLQAKVRSLLVVEQLCGTVLHPCTMRFQSAVWNLCVELTLYFNL